MTATTVAWMSISDVAAESGRHRESVYQALDNGLLPSTQAGPNCRRKVKRTDFGKWMDLGAPITAGKRRKRAS